MPFLLEEQQIVLQDDQYAALHGGRVVVPEGVEGKKVVVLRAHGQGRAVGIGHQREVDGAAAGGIECDAAAIGAQLHEHVGLKQLARVSVFCLVFPKQLDEVGPVQLGIEVEEHQHVVDIDVVPHHGDCGGAPQLREVFDARQLLVVFGSHYGVAVGLYLEGRATGHGHGLDAYLHAYLIQVLDDGVGLLQRNEV